MAAEQGRAFEVTADIARELRTLGFSAAQVAAISPPDRDPSMPGEQYFPPLQSVRKKYCELRRALSRKSNVELPFSA